MSLRPIGKNPTQGEIEMESTVASPGGASAAPRVYPGLALALALLSVPGSLLTWDTLPGGGFVFGAPLAIVAVVLGVQARQRSRAGRGKALAAILIAGAMLAMMVVWTVVEASGASAQSPATGTLTFKALEKGSTFTHVRNTKPKTERTNSTRDVIVFTEPLADASGTVVGTLHVDCVTTRGARNFLRSTLTCAGVIALRDGTLTLQANTKPGVPTTTGAVTGGTGAYANAHGVFVSKDTSAGGDTTITLAD
jgi:hypothetical protein